MNLSKIIAEEQKKFEEMSSFFTNTQIRLVDDFLSASLTRVALAMRDAMVVEERKIGSENKDEYIHLHGFNSARTQANLQAEKFLNNIE